MLRSVMVAVDFSEESALVLGFATGLTRLGVRRVVLGHAVDASGMEGPIIASKVDKVRESMRAMAVPLSDAGLEVEVRVATGDAVNELVALAAETHVDAVVCGTHGKGYLTKLIARSVSEQIALEADRPTMLIRFGLLRTKEDGAQLSRGFGTNVLLPTDFSSSATRALMAVSGLPKGALGTVYLLHVLDESLTGDRLRRAQEGAEFQLENLRAIAEQAGITARGIVRQGDPQRAILQEVNERRVSGIVVGRRGQGPLQEALLGSTSMTLVRQASCPVMVVP